MTKASVVLKKSYQGISLLSVTEKICERFTSWKVSKYEVFPGPYFPVFSPNTGKHGPGKTPYLVNFHAVIIT